MTEIKCPKCGTVISLEQSDLDSIVKQVRDEEFAHDLEERVKLVEAEKKREVELAEAKADAAFREREHERETELEHLRMQLATQQETYDAKRELAVAQAVASVEKERDALAATVELNKAEMARAEASFKEQLAEQAKSKDDIITDLMEDMAAEQKARTTYDNILRLIKDPEICDPIRFLREREIVHFQRFGEALRLVQERLNSRNFYACNPGFDMNCGCNCN